MTIHARVVRFHEIGGPDVLKIEEVRLDPLGPGEVRVRIDAIGLNRAEALFRAGTYYYQPTLPGSRLGVEAAGTVEEVGREVAGFAPGDAVSVISDQEMSHHGLYADRVHVPAQSLLPRPATVDAITGAALWTTYLTAYGALVEVGRVNPGDGVVITAASSGVGLAAIQLVNHLGAVPIAVTRTDAKSARLLRAGAAHVLAANQGDLAGRVHAITGGQGARVVFDAVGGPALSDLAQTVAADGLLIVYGWLDPRPAPLPMNWPITVHGFNVDLITSDPARMTRARAFIEAGLRAGTLKPVIDRTFELANIVEAHRHLESNAQTGKIVVTVQH
ncbi:NADPH:quinone reductase-like Zn-dependent oxidoreductase [Nonomuraea thailandensis]|uniref:NADPH:quinone reductase-like Zn-dependent oxidoreductase n=1 Tax=Nonomuraea thailandensis TaxID=1188745 RepID=A0A9X2JZ02_9ACTN|nr:zinc-dependent alcohol dehydrogenase family protein [Nonomuraea thailandensis]MCP2353230.1 NADPH:quinone reductase-like Zn-dependent oxidoreductase [Nonomuraea thailandensis]